MSEEALLGGSWVVKIRVISRITIGITHISGLIAPIITTHEPPSGLRGIGGLLGPDRGSWWWPLESDRLMRQSPNFCEADVVLVRGGQQAFRHPGRHRLRQVMSGCP